jgi:RHS repeat-associated protein
LTSESDVAITGATLRRYVHGPGEDEPLVWYEGSGTTDRRWLHGDERGSIIAVTNGSGAVLGKLAYDEYGIPASGNLGRFQYTGQTWLPQLGMYYYKARIYSPTLGRFMQTDPIGFGGGPNFYNYVNGDPVNRGDPSGLMSNKETEPKPNCPEPNTSCQDEGGESVVNGFPQSERIDFGLYFLFLKTYSNLGSGWAGSGGGSGGGGAPAPQKAQPPCVNADGTVDGKNTGSNMPGFGDVWATGGGVVAAAGAGGGKEKGVWYDRASGAHGTFVTTYYMVGTPGGGVAGNVTNFYDLASFTGWSTGVSGAGAVFGGGGAQSSTGGWGHTISGGFRTPQLSAYKSYTTITSGLSICKK